MQRHELLHPAVERNLRRRKRRGLARGKRRLQPADGFHPQRRNRNRQLGGLVLDCVEPVRIGTRVFEQAVARAQRAFECIDAGHMLGIDGEHETIEKAPALGGRAVEQPVHGRHQPDDPQVIGKGGRGRYRLPIDAAFAHDHGAFDRRRFDAGPERCQAERAFDIGCYRPGSVAFGKRHVVERRAPQPAAGCEK